jgi:hypothetical protein
MTQVPALLFSPPTNQVWASSVFARGARAALHLIGPFRLLAWRAVTVFCPPPASGRSNIE